MALTKRYKTAGRARTAARSLRKHGFRAFTYPSKGSNVRRNVFVSERRS